jgi:hypothetical protein
VDVSKHVDGAGHVVWIAVGCGSGICPSNNILEAIQYRSLDRKLFS